MFSFETMLRHHLRYNLYPPIVDGEEFAEACIAAVNEGDEDRLVMVEGFKGIAGSVVESWHLEPFLDEEGVEWD